MPASEPSATAAGSAGQSRTERVIERSVIVFAQSMVILAIAAAGYGFLVAMFFFCCGVDTVSYFHPSKSPLGQWVTILIIWPLVGLLCVGLQGGPGELLDLVRKGVRRVVVRTRTEKSS